MREEDIELTSIEGSGDDLPLHVLTEHLQWNSGGQKSDYCHHLYSSHFVQKVYKDPLIRCDSAKSWKPHWVLDFLWMCAWK